jgi:hypothetical protein
MDGYKETFGEETHTDKIFKDSAYTWTYGSKDNSSIKTYKINEKEPAVASASNKNNNSLSFGRTAESFLSNLNKKSNNDVDLSQYEAGVRVFHKKFGEGTINMVEPEGEDLKVDINFDKVGHKRLMAKFANLQVIE